MTALLSALSLWAAVISWYDWKQRRVPNVALILVLVPAVLALVLMPQGLLGMGRGSSLGGMALGFALTLPGYVLKRFGAGDVKFAAVLGLLLGAARGFEMVLWASILMGLSAAGLYYLSAAPRSHKFPAAPMLAVAFIAEMWLGPVLLE